MYSYICTSTYVFTEYFVIILYSYNTQAVKVIVVKSLIYFITELKLHT